MNLQLSTKEQLNLNLGMCFFVPNLELERIDKVIIINPKLNFGYWSKGLLAALNNGLINQIVYDAIKNNENESRQYYTIDSSLNVDKSTLLGLINGFGLQGIETGGNSFSILVQLNELNYQLISKI